MPAPNEISPAQLMRLLGTPNAPVIIDVCINSDFDQDPRVIPTARRWAHKDILNLPENVKDRHIVVLCQKGLKLSQGAAALLRSEGINAEYLEGGNHGWIAAGYPMTPVEKRPALSQHGSRWVTRHRPKIDRIAVPWLIRRFVDPEASFLFVSPATVEAVAEKFDAIAFDIEGVAFSHHGSACTFDAVLSAFCLHTAPLARMATVIRAADTNRHDLAPEAAGLLALSVGLSRQYKDDQQQLQAGFALYDALYRWARDGHTEGHDWPTATGGAS